MGRGGGEGGDDFMVVGINMVVVLREKMGVLDIGGGRFEGIEGEEREGENVLGNGGFMFVRGKLWWVRLEVGEMVGEELEVRDGVMEGGVGM